MEELFRFLYEDNQEKQDEESNLPNGWEIHPSVSFPGKFYFVSPEGRSQWSRPLEKLAFPQSYQWHTFTEVSFDSTELGIGLREIPQNTSVNYPQFNVYVKSIPSHLSNGEMGTIKKFNMMPSNKDKQVRIGMRVTKINSLTLVGYSYFQIIRHMKTCRRPFQIQFADVDIGTVQEKQERDDLRYHQELLDELVSVKHCHNLKYETSQLLNKSLAKKKFECQLKLKVLLKEHNKLHKENISLEKDYRNLKIKTKKYLQIIDILNKQENEMVPSIQEKKYSTLCKKYDELSTLIHDLRKGNSKLQSDRKKYKDSLLENACYLPEGIEFLLDIEDDVLQRKKNDMKLGKLKSNNNHSQTKFYLRKQKFLDGLDENATTEMYIEYTKRRVDEIQEELRLEEERVCQFNAEVQFLNTVRSNHGKPILADIKSDDSECKGQTQGYTDRFIPKPMTQFVKDGFQKIGNICAVR